jgi:hypothetical protein
MMMKSNLLKTFLLAFIAIGCISNNRPKNFDYGHVENGKYVNSFFNFEIILPTNWIIQTKQQIEHLTNLGKDIIAGDDATMKTMVKASDINTAYLLMDYQYERGSAVEFNPNISLIAENIKDAPGIKTGSDYLFQTRKILGQSQFKYDYLDKEFEKEEINGTDFYKMNAEINTMGINVKQIYYSTVLNGFSFNVIISFINDQQKNDLLQSINSMKFKN